MTSRKQGDIWVERKDRDWPFHVYVHLDGNDLMVDGPWYDEQGANDRLDILTRWARVRAEYDAGTAPDPA